MDRMLLMRRRGTMMVATKTLLGRRGPSASATKIILGNNISHITSTAGNQRIRRSLCSLSSTTLQSGSFQRQQQDTFGAGGARQQQQQQYSLLSSSLHHPRRRTTTTANNFGSSAAHIIRQQSSALPDSGSDSDSDSDDEASAGSGRSGNGSGRARDSIEYLELGRIKHLRNVGVLAHVDSGKTTVTERMLALAGVVRHAGCVDDGNTVTDYLPQERERGITIQSAAISLQWGLHNHKKGDDMTQNDNVSIQLIDTPGHVDFSVEVNRSVAVLDGAVLVLDAVAGVQAQTETVWRAITRPSLNNHIVTQQEDTTTSSSQNDHAHEPLPCLAVINKMDKDGCNFGRAVQSIRDKLPGANPVPCQIPIFRTGTRPIEGSIGPNDRLSSNLVSVLPDDVNTVSGEFVGVVDLIHMRAVVWPDSQQRMVDNVENCIPSIVNLLQPLTHEPIHDDCAVTELAVEARYAFQEALAEIDPTIEEYYLQDEEPSNAEVRAALRRATLSRKAVPVLAAAALKGKGIEPLLDSVADLLPSPLDRLPPALHQLNENGQKVHRKKKSNIARNENAITLGHPRHNSALALAFKVVHMKGRGSGDGRVVFARVYSGELKDRDQLQVITPPAPGEVASKPRTERIGGMLELAGGRFDNVEGGVVKSGEVCALVGLKTVKTGDTILLASEASPNNGKGKKNKTNESALACLAGVASPKPVITVRLEAETSQEQKELSEALKLMSIEDPSLVVEETDSMTLLSGLGELHIEVILDRLAREHGLKVMVGPPSVAYRETVKSEIESPGGLVNYDQTFGGTRLQAAVHLVIRPCRSAQKIMHGDDKASCMLLSSPTVTIGPQAREFLCLNPDLSEDELIVKSEIARALIRGCEGALKRGPLQSAEMTNVTCHVEAVDAEDGLSSLKALPGALQAASAYAISTTLRENSDHCTVLEPTMSVEVLLPNDMVGDVLSDLSNRRGLVGDVIVGEDTHSKALVRGDVPLSEILGYANSLRSLTGGEGAFTSEYKGHSPC
mmetsp:Transcript_31962/g.77738  ORF Transcript_31962/g.77738 Transcript_31962/m.77738 type:complete len:1014 (-) Transcript_31962:1628-4669(-)